ncbi:oligoendopeptidase F, partial [candidate division KSB1 bacterium]|nr:oligoendopeptidase F [candidate division KSB1 bacterium]
MKGSVSSIFVFAVVVLIFSQTVTTAKTTKERAEIDINYTWNLQDIYESDEAWNAAKEKITTLVDKVTTFKGTLSNSAADLLACLDFNSQFTKEFVRLLVYASMASDQDTRNSKYLAMKQEIFQIGTNFNAKASYIEPEIIQIDKEKIDKFIESEAGLKIYRVYLDNLQRMKIHTLSDKEEKILAEAGLMAGTPSSIFSIFTNAELPYPEVKLSDGTTVTLDQSGFGRYRAVPNRDDRKAVFDTFWATMKKFQGTLGEQLYSQVKKDMFYMRSRGYNSCLESAIYANNIPVSVYMALIDNVNNNLGTFHRYLNLKKRMLGVDTLKYYDMYAPVVKGVDLKYSYEEAQDLILDALQPLGKDYISVVNKAFTDRWIDVYPNVGKRSGAYSNGSVYDGHPYILLNYNEQYNDVSTLAHELGHTMHSYLANARQPYPTSDYPIFVAEVASTFNEALLIEKVLQDVKDDETRLSLLMNHLDGIKGTVFRQTQFAEFELRIHEKAERGEPLTGEVITQIYGDIFKKYYGHDKGICVVDDLYLLEWTYIPHFYYNFYVYQYATSFTASIALSEKALKKEKGIIEKYIDFLSSGGSDYPINLLKKAGVDMNTPEPFNKTIAAMNRTMDEIEK